MSGKHYEILIDSYFGGLKRLEVKSGTTLKQAKQLARTIFNALDLYSISVHCDGKELFYRKYKD